VCQLNSVNFDDYSDEQISEYWNKALGYSLRQLAVILRSKGVSSCHISKLKQQIISLSFSDNAKSATEGSNDMNAGISNLDKLGLAGTTPEEEEDNLIFGYKFFTNSSISFTPNLNLVTPATTYQFGPGDELLIDVWGATENNYRNKVDREGTIQIENIRPVYD